MAEQLQQEVYMEAAFAQAMKARVIDEVPVGAVIVYDGKIIARAHNRRESKKNPCAHAELLAILKAAKKLKSWRLSGAELYVTLEPCPMCAGAIINSRIDRVYFGAYDSKAGAFGSLLDLNTYGLNHKPEVIGGVLQERCSLILKEYFQAKRLGKKKILQSQ
ncbi:MAG: tRNA-specific adenosine deaminase [Clostridiales bacterium]|nr:MAG: tRNA-specific adenosine deaminase [Clostridiales bacterium]